MCLLIKPYCLLIILCINFSILKLNIFAFGQFGDWWELGIRNATSFSNLGEVDPVALKNQCYNIDYFVDKQKEKCAENDKTLMILANGAKLAIEECQHQFRNSRWNCTIFPNNAAVFGNHITIRSRESAYLSAISAAGVSYVTTRACTKGDLNDCSCDNRVRKIKARPWKWGGCSEDIRYGSDFSREFLDVREDRNTASGLMNSHNNEAGRKTLRIKMHRVCKCHGMSGSCSMKVCWRKLPHFRDVGDMLMQRYEGASHVKLVSRKRKMLSAYNPQFKKANKTDLVYLDDSPDFCEENTTLTILGTRGRVCNRTSHGIDGCSLLCCGRGYQTRIREIEEQCNCKFIWCCEVKCQICSYKREEHICN